MVAWDTRVLKRLTVKLIIAEERSQHLKKLVKKKIGLREEEEFLRKEKSKLRGIKFDSKKKEKVIALIMEEKLKDNLRYQEEIKKLRNKARRKMEDGEELSHMQGDS